MASYTSLDPAGPSRPTKRALRSFVSDSATLTSSSMAGQRYGIDEGVTSRLTGLGMNVRKNVSEGYKVTAVSSPSPEDFIIPPYNPSHPTAATRGGSFSSSHASTSPGTTLLTPTSNFFPNTSLPNSQSNDFPDSLFLSSSDAYARAKRDVVLQQQARRLKPWKSLTDEERASRGHGREVRAMADIGFDEAMAASRSGSENALDGMDMDMDGGDRLGLSGFAGPSTSTSAFPSRANSPPYENETRGKKRRETSSLSDDDNDEGDATDVDDDSESSQHHHQPSMSYSLQPTPAPAPFLTPQKPRPTRRMPRLRAAKSMPQQGSQGMDVDVEMDGGSGSGNGALSSWVGRTDF